MRQTDLQERTWNKNGKQMNVKPQLDSNGSLLHVRNLGIASM